MTLLFDNFDNFNIFKKYINDYNKLFKQENNWLKKRYEQTYKVLIKFQN